MDKKFRSIIDEINDYAPKLNRDLFIESRGQQVIASACHLITLMRESYSAEMADDLAKRLVKAIASGDEEKFRRGVRAIREGKKKKAPVP